LSEEILKGKFKGLHKIKVVLEDDAPTFIEAEEATVLSGVN